MLGESKKWALPAFIVTLVLLVTAGVIIGVLAWPDFEVRLHLDDEHTAAWISHDNAFAYKGLKPEKFRSGVVFQLGTYREYRDAPTGSNESARPTILTTFESLEIHGTDGTKTFMRGEFDWINIVGEHKGKDPNPVDASNVGLLYPDNTKTLCSDVDACAGAACLCPPECNLEEIPERCLRLRRIDARFVPTAVITYWQGKKGYDVEARYGPHSSFDFLLKDEVTVTVYKGGEPLPFNVGTIQKIIIRGPHVPGHGEAHDPGMGGGR